MGGFFKLKDNHRGAAGNKLQHAPKKQRPQYHRQKGSQEWLKMFAVKYGQTQMVNPSHIFDICKSEKDLFKK